MNKTTLLLITSIFIANANAAVLLVNNTSGGPGQYNSIQAAINAALPNDTIYISGSAITYTGASIDKGLTLIGAGTFAQKDMQFPTSIGPTSIAAGVNNVSIRGINLSTAGNGNNINFGPNAAFITISECYFTNACCGNALMYFSSNHDIIFENNIFNTNQDLIDNSSPTCYNFIFRNNLIHTNTACLSDLNIPNAVIEHNTFIASTPGTAIFLSTSNANFNSNVFYNLNPTSGYANCTFNNNITFNTTGTAFNALGGTNIDNIDPQFVNLASLSFNLSNNYQVSSTGPAHNASADGTDIGYYGGTSNANPWGEIFNQPVIRKMDVQNTSVPQNGNVNVKVRSTVSR